MKQSVLIAGALSLCIATSAVAQRGMRGGGSGRGGRGRGDESESSSAAVLSGDDLAKLDPARLMIDKAKTLHLTSPQKLALDSIGKRYDWNVRIFAREIDSLVGTSGGRREPQDADSSAGEARRRALRDAVRSIQDEFTTALSAALARLDEEQRSTATSFILDDRAKLDALVSQPRLSRTP